MLDPGKLDAGEKNVLTSFLSYLTSHISPPKKIPGNYARDKTYNHENKRLSQ
jgi:hypothetical protein